MDVTKLAERLTALVGIITGGAALIYATGAAVYAAVLHSHGVPTALSIATSLPREFLIGSGLLFVALPVALASLVLFLLTAVLIQLKVAGSEQWRTPTAAGVIFIGCIGLAIAVQPCSWIAIAGVLAATAVTVALLTPLVLALAGLSATTDHSNSTTTNPKSRMIPYLIAVAVLLMTGWGVWIGISRTKLPDALLCTKSKGDYPGFLIGETGTHVYVGDDPELRSKSTEGGNHPIDSTGKKRIISIQSDEVAELFIGSAEGECLLTKAQSDEQRSGHPSAAP